MFRRNFKNNLKDEIICNEKRINDMFNFIEIVINFNDKLYKKVIKKNTINSKKEQEFSLN